MEHFHFPKLQRLCRVCGELLGKRNFDVLDFKGDLVAYIFIHIEDDNAEVHPSKMCLRCWSRLKNVKSRGSTTPHANFIWKPHTQANCGICQHHDNKKKGGRRKYKSKPNKHQLRNIWTTAEIEKLINTTKQMQFNTPPHLNYPEALNSHLHMCKCIIC